jgi:hypothetical protein
MLAVTKAEIARASGNPDQAIGALTPLLDGTELFVTHVALMNAYAAKKDNASALREAQWLASHRGRAYAEQSPRFVLMPYNVAESDLALLAAAEFAAAAGDKARARQELEAFDRAWPPNAAEPRALLASRIARIRTTL